MSNQTVTVQIGNSDDKLAQARWASFVAAVDELVTQTVGQVHFHGFAPAAAAWQNACWVFEIAGNSTSLLRYRLGLLAAEYEQESIAWTGGDTEFIQALGA